MIGKRGGKKKKLHTPNDKRKLAYFGKRGGKRGERERRKV